MAAHFAHQRALPSYIHKVGFSCEHEILLHVCTSELLRDINKILNNYCEKSVALCRILLYDIPYEVLRKFMVRVYRSWVITIDS